MNTKRVCLIGASLLGVFVLMQPAQRADGAAAQNHKPVMITHFFTGPDGLTHVEEIEAKFAPGGGNDLYKLLANSGAVLRRSSPGRENGWHTASKRQYVITLSGHGELEFSDGKKISVGPGSIELAEDTTGKGHITRTVGTEDRVSIAIPLTDQK